VYNFRLCLVAKFLSFSLIIWLWTGSPPGELTTTARAVARRVLTFFSRFTTDSVLDGKIVTVWMLLDRRH
jgi:hypothetical protein